MKIPQFFGTIASLFMIGSFKKKGNRKKRSTNPKCKKGLSTNNEKNKDDDDNCGDDKM